MASGPQTGNVAITRFGHFAKVHPQESLAHFPVRLAPRSRGQPLGGNTAGRGKRCLQVSVEQTCQRQSLFLQPHFSPEVVLGTSGPREAGKRGLDSSRWGGASCQTCFHTVFL